MIALAGPACSSVPGLQLDAAGGIEALPEENLQCCSVYYTSRARLPTDAKGTMPNSITIELLATALAPNNQSLTYNSNILTQCCECARRCTIAKVVGLSERSHDSLDTLKRDQS